MGFFNSNLANTLCRRGRSMELLLDITSLGRMDFMGLPLPVSLNIRMDNRLHFRCVLKFDSKLTWRLETLQRTPNYSRHFKFQPNGCRKTLYVDAAKTQL